MPTSQLDDLSGRSALVTGGLGFIGSLLAKRLEEVGAIVHTASRRPAPVGTAGRHRQVDLSDATAAARLVRETRPDFVFHLAGHVTGSIDARHVLPAFRANLQSTVNLLTELAEVGCARMVTAGSLVEPEAESHEMPGSPYAVAKWASSDYVRMFHALYRVPATIARVFMVYGPGQQDQSKLVPYVIHSVLRGETAKLTSGTRTIDWVFLDDVVDGFLRLAVSPNVDGKSVDLGSGTATTIRALVEKIHALMGAESAPLFGAIPDRPLEPIRVANTAESLRLTGWSPTIDLDSGLYRTIEWYRQRFAE